MASEFEIREQVLRACIRDVYAVFRRYKLAVRIEPDTCFPLACDERPLRAAPLHELPPDAFRYFVWKAVSTWGTIDDFKHFLPRLLELTATAPAAESENAFDRFTLFDKLTYADWRSWREKERTAVGAYFHALWAYLLARPLELSNLDCYRQKMSDWLGDFAAAYTDLSPFLCYWQTSASDPEHGLNPALHLATTVTQELTPLTKKGQLGWRDDVAAQRGQLETWLAATNTARLLETAYFRWEDSPHSTLLSQAHHWLSSWTQSSPPP